MPTPQRSAAYIKGGGGRETIDEAAEKLVDLTNDPASASKFMRAAVKVRKRDIINEIWVNGPFSGPRTHIDNAVSNTMTMPYTLPEQALTATIGKLLKTHDRALMREVSVRTTGMSRRCARRSGARQAGLYR